jgi:hypothetical protein
MSIIGGKAKTGRNKVRAEVPMPSDIDGVLQAVRAILLKDNVTQINIREGDVISYEREVDPAEEMGPVETNEGFADIRPMDVVRNAMMEEFSVVEQGLEGAGAQTILFWMIFLLEYEGWAATHLVVSASSDVWKWMGIPQRAAKRLEKLINLKIEKDEDLPNEVFLVCGSRHQGAVLTEVGYVIKGSVPYERDQQESNRSRNHSSASDKAIKALAKSP